MEHFADEDWADFTRNLGGEEKRQSMKQHLNSGCDACRNAMYFWSEMVRKSTKDETYEPPANVLRSVKVMGSLHLAQPSRPRFALAKLVMDTSRSFAMAGVRSTAAAPAARLYQFGGVNIDLRIEPVPASKQVSIIGQVLDTEKIGQITAGIQVAAMADGGAVYKTTTNNFGEFQLEFEPVSEMYLAVHIDKQMEIWVPLNDAIAGYPQGS